MIHYQVIARKYRPQTFDEVLGQSAIVTTLKNSIRFNRLAHAYLFSGPRGTGKTTLARVFAKTLNCLSPLPDRNPCSKCSSCKEIASGSSLDVIEIDGASHRGIDDIRQINENAGYSASGGKYKIYIIDEVHMLTKEAFNALLKTLEEPPERVKFFFATTEPHKVLPTIVSRCQRYHLNRIPLSIILQKLQAIAKDLQVDIEPAALELIAKRAEGGLRDAESLFDQILAFHDQALITKSSVESILGIVAKECFFALDKAGKERNYSIAYEISEKVYSEGKDIPYFIESLMEHFRKILLYKTSRELLSIEEQEEYENSSRCYSQSQCIDILNELVEAYGQIRHMPFGKISLEIILINILRSHQKISIDLILQKLEALSASAHAGSGSSASLTVDPTPSERDLGFQKQPAAIDLGARLTPEAKSEAVKNQNRTETLLQFAAVELEGILEKSPNKTI